MEWGIKGKYGAEVGLYSHWGLVVVYFLSSNQVDLLASFGSNVVLEKFS